MRQMSGKSSASPIKLLVFRNPADLSIGAAEYLADQIRQVQGNKTDVSLMLSGGSTPRGVYSYLASPELAGKIDWSRISIFWSDERCVPPEHADSNFNLAYQSLIKQVPIDVDHIHRIRGEIDPIAAAQEYEAELASHGGNTQNPPSIDFLLLGMGEDGHIASLFPRSPAAGESKRWVVAVPHDSPPPPQVWRISVTFPLIFAASHVIVIVSGSNKAARVQQALYGDLTEPALPVQRLRQAPRETIWLLDQGAASGG